LNTAPELIDEIAAKCGFSVMVAHKNANIPQHMNLVTNITDRHVFYGKGLKFLIFKTYVCRIRILDLVRFII
jgi:hypothetical protein